MIGNVKRAGKWVAAVVIPAQGDIYLGVALCWDDARMTNFLPLAKTAFAKDCRLSIKEENIAGHLVEWAATKDLARLHFLLIILTKRAEAIRAAGAMSRRPTFGT